MERMNEFEANSTLFVIPSYKVSPYSTVISTKINPLVPTIGVKNTSTVTITYTPTILPTNTPLPFIMCSPLKNETINSLWEIITNPFGYPPVGREDLHHGVDFAYYRRGDRLSIEGEIVQSMLPGIVAASILDRLPYGNMVIIETPHSIMPDEFNKKIDLISGESLYSLYAHMGQAPHVELGEKINCGQELGTVGVTGYDIVNPHLHLETRIGSSDISFPGMAFYDTSASIEEMDNYLRWRISGDFKNIDPMMVFAEYISYAIPNNQVETP